MPSQNTADSFSVYFGTTGLTLTTTLSKAGGSFSTVAPTIVDAGNGFYLVTPLAEHRDTLGVNSWLFDGGAVQMPYVETVENLYHYGDNQKHLRTGGDATSDEVTVTKN